MKKIGLLSLALVLALGSLGVAYALWWDDLYVQGNVDTGDLCWEWTGVTCMDPGPAPGQICYDYHCNPGFVPNQAGLDFWQGDKDCGWTTCEVKPDDHHRITLTLNNVYPCYFNEISVYAINCGTMALHFEKVIFTSPFDTGFIVTSENTIDSLDLDGDGKDDIEFKWGNHLGMQLHPGDRSGEISFWLHILQECPQEEPNLTFTITLVAQPWNDSAWPPATPVPQPIP